MNKKQNIVNRELYVCLGLIVTAGFFLLLFSPYTTLLNNYFGYDTALWHVIGRGITQGKVPYRDLFEHKGPLLFFIYSFGWFCPNQRLAMYLLQWIFFSVTLVYAYRICRLYMGQKKGILGILFFLFLFCGTIGEGAMSEEWSLPFIMITIYYALRYLLQEDVTVSHPVKFGFLYGVCFGCVASIRLNNAAPIAGVILAFIIIMILRKQYICILQNAVAFLVGMMIPMIPIIIWYWKRDALNYLVWGAFLFNFHYAVNAWEIRTLWQKIRPWLTAVPYLVLLLVNYYDYKETRKRDAEILIAVSSTVTIVILMFGYSYMHYFTIFLPFLMIAFCMLLHLPKQKKIYAVLAVIVMLAPFTWQSARNMGKSILLNTQGWYDNMEAEIRDFMDQIPEKDRDSVWGNGSAFSKVFCISGITPCFPYFDNGAVHYVMDPSMNDATVDMFENNPPKWIIVPTIGESHIAAMEKYIPEMYELYDVLDGEKHLELYRLVESR